jgi:hypothetical protein
LVVANERNWDLRKEGQMSPDPAAATELRRRAIADARRSSELEGSSSTEATRADQDAYVRGELDIDQLGHRVRARYGLA